MSRDRFVEVVRDGLQALPQDLKAMLRIVDDADIDEDSRVRAAGALVHLLSAQNAIPGVRGMLAYVDDVLVLRFVLEHIKKENAEAVAAHEADSPTLVARIDDDMEATREFLGDLASVLQKAADGVAKLTFAGKTAEGCVVDADTGRWLYDQIYAKAMDLDFAEDDVERTIKSLDQILPPLKQRLAGARP